MSNLSKRFRTASAICTVALVSLGSGACMMGGGSMSPAAMQSHSAMHHFTTAVHMGEIEEAQLALSRSSNAQVRSYAQQMIAHHTPAMQREMQLMGAMGMGLGMRAGMSGGASGSTSGMGMQGGASMEMGQTRTMLMENPYSRPVVEDHMRAMQMLQGMSGMAFDRAYMNRQVVAHRYALENVDRMMAGAGMSMGMGADGTMASGSTSSGTMSGQGSAAMGGNMNMSTALPATAQGMMTMQRENRAMIAMHLQMAQQMMQGMGGR